MPQRWLICLVGWMGPFHEGREWLQRDEAQRSIGPLAMQTLMLAATGLGYQSLPDDSASRSRKLAELIHLPEDHVMGPMVAHRQGPPRNPLPKAGPVGPRDPGVDNGF